MCVTILSTAQKAKVEGKEYIKVNIPARITEFYVENVSHLNSKNMHVHEHEYGSSGPIWSY